MSYEKSDSFLVRFNGKNYSACEFQFKLFVKGKDLWGHIDGKKNQHLLMGNQRCSNHDLET